MAKLTKAYVAEASCNQLLMIKIAIYLFAQDQNASNCINVCTYVQVRIFRQNNSINNKL